MSLEYADRYLSDFDTSTTLRLADEGNVRPTPRAIEALSYIAEGDNRAEVASKLGLSPLTVKQYLHTAYVKLGVNSAFPAIAWCLDNGVLPSERFLPEDYEERLADLNSDQREILDLSMTLNTRDHGRAIGGTIFLAPNYASRKLSNIVSQLGAKNRVHAQTMHRSYLLNKLNSKNYVTQ